MGKIGGVDMALLRPFLAMDFGRIPNVQYSGQGLRWKPEQAPQP